MSGYRSKRVMAKSKITGDEIVIEGLSQTQVDLLDIMWGFDELEELEAWRDTLRPGMQVEVDDLIKKVILAHMENLREDALNNETQFPEAQAVLQKFRL